MSYPPSVFVLPRDTRARMDMLSKQHEKATGEPPKTTDVQTDQADIRAGKNPADTHEKTSQRQDP